MRTIALVNQKGGVGKSTTAVNLSAGLARLGKRVLVIDLDPQAHSTVALGLDPRKLDKTVYTLLSGQASASEVIRPVSPGLSIIPSNIHLAGGEPELSQLPEPAYVLQRAMAGIDASQYDYAIVDCSPQLGFLNVNCLVWVREIYIPVTCEFYALHGLSLIMDTVDRLRARLNPELRISGVITCQVHPRRAVTRDVLAELEKHFPGRVLRTRIRVNVRLVEAPSHGKSIFDYAPDSNGAADYLSLAQEVVEREALAPAPVTEAPAAVCEPEPVAAAVEVAPPVAEPEPQPEPAPVEATVEAPPPVVEPEPEPVVAEAAVPAEEPAAPVVEVPSPAVEPEPEPVVAEAAAPVEEPAAPVVETAVAPVETPPPFVELPAGAPLTTPVAPTAAPSLAPTGSTPYAEMLGLGGLKPIVVARPGGLPPSPAPETKGTFGKRLLGKLMGRKI